MAEVPLCFDVQSTGVSNREFFILNEFGIERWREHMRGKDIPKMRCAWEAGRTKMTSTINEELYRIEMLFGTLSGRTTRNRGGGNEGR